MQTYYSCKSFHCIYRITVLKASTLTEKVGDEMEFYTTKVSVNNIDVFFSKVYVYCFKALHLS